MIFTWECVSRTTLDLDYLISGISALSQLRGLFTCGSEVPALKSRRTFCTQGISQTTGSDGGSGGEESEESGRQQ